MSIDAQVVDRCKECGRAPVFSNFNRKGHGMGRCPHCMELRPKTEKTLRLVVRKGVSPPIEIPARDPDLEFGDAEVYVSQTRGEATIEVEQEEWQR